MSEVRRSEPVAGMREHRFWRVKVPEVSGIGYCGDAPAHLPAKAAV